MIWEIEYTDEFGDWWVSLGEREQDEIAVAVGLLEKEGPKLMFPHSSGVGSSKHSHMRELRRQCLGNPYRVLYAFDPKRRAILLLGGDKTGDDRWYEKNVPMADKLYDFHLKEIEREENGK